MDDTQTQIEAVKKPLTAKALAQRKAAGEALAAQRGSEYYSFIGRLGWRKARYNQLMNLAENFNGFPAEVKCTPERLQEIIDDQRQRYNDATGNHVLPGIFTPAFSRGQSKKNRLKVPKSSGRTPRIYANPTGVTTVLAAPETSETEED